MGRRRRRRKRRKRRKGRRKRKRRRFADHQPHGSSSQSSFRLTTVDVVSRGVAGDVETIERWGSVDRSKVCSLGSGLAIASGDSVSTSSSCPKFDHDVLPIQVSGALDVSFELSFAIGEEVEYSVLLDVEISLDNPWYCLRSISHEYSVDLEEGSKLDDTFTSSSDSSGVDYARAKVARVAGHRVANPWVA